MTGSSAPIDPATVRETLNGLRTHDELLNYLRGDVEKAEIDSKTKDNIGAELTNLKNAVDANSPDADFIKRLLEKLPQQLMEAGIKLDAEVVKGGIGL